MKQNEHGRILAAAAKRHLHPAGARRKGQSRVWLIDQGYWLVQIEFQPSAWSKGSYLNVGAHWLWRWEPGPITFDYDHRVADFVEFQSPEQFEPEADRLASRAAEKARELETTFKSVEDTSRVLASPYDQGLHGWAPCTNYHAAVAAGLAGDIVRSRRLFEQVEACYPDPARSVAVTLMPLLGDQAPYRAAVEAMMARQREHHKLPTCPNPFGITGLT